MLSLAQYLVAEGIGKSEFARRLTDRLGKRVPPQSVHRWTLPRTEPDYAVPRAKVVEAIAAETENQVAPASWYEGGMAPARKTRPLAVSVAASRKGWASRRKQREVRP